MRKRLARTLWILAVASLGFAGCGKKESASGHTSADKVVAPEFEAPVEDTTVAAAEEKGEMAAGGRAVAQPGYLANGSPMTPAPVPPPDLGTGSEDYTDYGVNPMTLASKDRFSTFAIDVDTASYAIARRKIMNGQLPPKASVRVEEFVNYFRYDYAGPTGDLPFAVQMDAAPSPFHGKRHLLRVGVQARKLSIAERKPANLVFLVDVSGSMNSPDKLPLAKRALRVMLDNLKDGDTVALVTYAGNTRVVLPPTDVAQRGRIASALEELNASGSTAMSSGLELAYDLAGKNLRPGAVSRVIVLSDGDANVGNTSHDQILDAIAAQVKEGVTLSTIGLGMGNYKDTMMEQLANKGNGNYYYIDGISQAKRVFQEQLGGTLEVVAKDVKIQVEMDPSVVKSYRLVGYENRDIADDDFRDDKVDAGEIGAGHSVTAIYEVELAGATPASLSRLATVRIRHKAPRGSKASEHAFSFDADRLAPSFEAASADFRFAVAAMATAEVLRGSPHATTWKLDRIRAIAESAAPKGNAERHELVALIDKIAPLHKMAAR
jgi:Ca-activated chloride channel family protein